MLSNKTKIVRMSVGGEEARAIMSGTPRKLCKLLNKLMFIKNKSSKKVACVFIIGSGCT
jgi:hypothetical protein